MKNKFKKIFAFILAISILALIPATCASAQKPGLPELPGYNWDEFWETVAENWATYSPDPSQRSQSGGIGIDETILEP